MVLTPVLPAVVLMDNGRKSFFNQVIAAYLGWQGVKENPCSALMFGDGSPIPTAYLDFIAQLTREFTYELQWQEGDVALVDNYTTMHGRRSYGGDRKRQVLVAMAGKY